MKIATWNFERLCRNKNQFILDKIAAINADILILTETNSKINPGYDYSFVSTDNLENDFEGIDYKPGENRTTNWTKYNIKRIIKTYDNYTSAYAEIQTSFGLLNVYGTIIGVFWGKDNRFKSDFEYQISDFKKLKGNIRVESSEGVGTVFTVTLPVNIKEEDIIWKLFL